MLMKTLKNNLNYITGIFILLMWSVIFYNVLTYGIINYISFNGI